MSIHQPLTDFADAKPVTFVPLANRAHRAFDLHPALFVATIGCYLGYVSVMALAFMTAEMIIPFIVFAITIVAAFAVPAMWARVEGPKAGRLPDWRDFLREGIETYTGHLSARSAIVQVMVMPVMLLGWGLIIATICAVIRATV